MTRFTERTATKHDIYEISRNLSDISREEMMSEPDTTAWDVFRTVVPLLDAGPTTVWCEDGYPIVVFGHDKHPATEKDRVTWLMATPRYFDLGMRSVRFSREFLKRLRRDWPNTKFWTYSSSTHPDVERWFGLLGYGPMVDQTAHYRAFALTPDTTKPALSEIDDTPMLA
jgi:hypothetical protein